MNPYMMNPMMMNMQLMHFMLEMNPYFKLLTMKFNPLGGNGIFHPVYVSPFLMHQLENGAPEFVDPDEQAARRGNKACSQGATITCADTGKKVRYRPNPLNRNDVRLREDIIPEQIACFAGCAASNPCDNRLYSSHMKSEQSCDGNAVK